VVSAFHNSDEEQNNEENEDEQDEDEQDEDEQDQEMSDEEEEEINVTIPRFPVQVICMENCETTLDELIELSKNSEHPRTYEVAGQFMKTMSDVSKDLLNLQKHTKTTLGKEFENTIHPVHGDCIEAILGAIYLDGGLEPCKKFINQFWKKISYEKNDYQSNPKVLLQEWAQKKGLDLPTYEIIHNEGTSHQPVFTVEVCVPNYEKYLGKGKNKKDAEQDAARQFMKTHNIH
jgi:hypothetical protein